MERFTQKELTRILQIGDPDHIPSEVVILEDTVWGLAYGVYRSIAELRIPLQYFNGEYNDINKYISYQLLTVLSHDFFDGIIPRKDDGKPLYIDPQVDIKGARKFISSGGDSDTGISARQVVEGFVEEFFSLYLNRNNEKKETRECLEKSFITCIRR